MTKKKLNKLGRIKKIAFFIPLFLWGISCFSQNWQLINPVYKYNYYTTNSSVSSATVWIDSIKNNINYLNRIIAPCDTCISSHLVHDLYDTAYVLSNQPTFLQRKFTVLNGIYHFTDRGNIVIHATDTLHATWLFDSINSINAQIISKTTATIFSVTDSIQVIKISCGDTIILSKNYGIIQYPKTYGQHDCYKLAGVEGINKGLQIVKFKDFFNFSIGDVFQYSINNQNYIFLPPIFTQGLKKITILNRIKNTDTISYLVKTTLLDSTWLGGNAATITYTTSIDTLTFIDSTNHFTNLYANQLVPVIVSSVFSPFTTPVINQTQVDVDTNNLPVKRYGVVCPNSMHDSTNYGVASSVDTINPYLYLIRNGVLILGREAKLGLGITSDVYNSYDEIKLLCLTSYVKGTDTVGSIIPDVQLSSIATDKVNSFNIVAFPNPANNIINITFSSFYKGEIEIYNNSGQQVFTDSVNNISQYKIDISNLNAGIYLIKCNYKNSVITKKIIIQ